VGAQGREHDGAVLALLDLLAVGVRELGHE